MKSAFSDFISGKRDLWYSSHYYINNVSFLVISISVDTFKEFRSIHSLLT